MEDKKTNGQQAEAQEGKKEPSAWLQEVATKFEAINAAIDQEQPTDRCLIVLAVHKEQSLIGFGGGSYPLAIAMKHVLTSPTFAPHIANAAKLLASEAAEHGKGTIVIEVNGQNPDDQEAEGEPEAETQEQSKTADE